MVGRSKVWRLSHFADHDRLEVQCDLCPTKIKFVGNTTNIARHLELKHPVEFGALTNNDLFPNNAANLQANKIEQESKKREQENNAIRRILQHHNQELRKLQEKQNKSLCAPDFSGFHDHSCDASANMEFSRMWSWHTPILSGEDRKHEGGGSHSGNLTSYPPGISENSRSSGENQGACDDVSVPVSPEQFLSEEMDQGGSPHTPSQRPESYKLRHNNHLMLVLESLAGDESFMDVTLTAQGKAIKAHKSVLSAVSPYFRSVLKENPCQHPIIIMPRDIRFEELNNIISYIYKGEMTVAAEDLSSLLKTAEILQVTGLSPSDSGAGAGGIMSQMQGLPSALFSNSTSKKSSKQKPPPPPPPSLQQSGDDASSDQQGRIDPLEFLNTDLSCVKEEVQSDNEDGGDESRFQPPLDMGRSNNSSEGSTNAPSEYPNASPVRNRSVDESSNKSEELSNKHFNPGESPPEGGETPSDASPSSSTPHLCPFCSETHRPLDALQTHLRLKHPSKAAFVCSCGRVFHRISLLTEHSKKCKV